MLADGSASPYSAVTTAVPQFSESIRNVTVPLGREAVLSCVINNLAEYKVSPHPHIAIRRRRKGNVGLYL
jgi:hypothetical protein